MNYKKAPKNALTRELAFLLNKKVSPVSSYDDNDGIVIYPHDNEVNFDPCNNWNDIMPIAVELGVTLIPDNCLSHFAYYKLELDVDGYSSELCEYDSSPQRALVICCIKVLEAQK